MPNYFVGPVEAGGRGEGGGSVSVTYSRPFEHPSFPGPPPPRQCRVCMTTNSERFLLSELAGRLGVTPGRGSPPHSRPLASGGQRGPPSLRPPLPSLRPRPREGSAVQRPRPLASCFSLLQLPRKFAVATASSRFNPRPPLIGQLLGGKKSTPWQPDKPIKSPAGVTAAMLQAGVGCAEKRSGHCAQVHRLRVDSSCQPPRPGSGHRRAPPGSGPYPKSPSRSGGGRGAEMHIGLEELQKGGSS